MDFNISKKAEMAIQLFRDFANNEIKPYVYEMDETEQMNMDIVSKMGKLGMLSIPIPIESGGAGYDYLTNDICVEEIVKISPSVAGVISVHTSLTLTAIYQMGTNGQKSKYLPDLTTGEKIGAFALTEPDSGSDVSNLQTRAILNGNNYVLNGTKIFISNAGFAGTFIVAATTDPSKGNKGISTFIVERGTWGFKIGREEKKMGIRASSTCELIFDNCVIPKENMLDKEGRGLNNCLTFLDSGRITIAALCVGIAPYALT